MGRIIAAIAVLVFVNGCSFIDKSFKYEPKENSGWTKMDRYQEPENIKLIIDSLTNDTLFIEMGVHAYNFKRLCWGPPIFPVIPWFFFKSLKRQDLFINVILKSEHPNLLHWDTKSFKFTFDNVLMNPGLDSVNYESINRMKFKPLLKESKYTFAFGNVRIPKKILIDFNQSKISILPKEIFIRKTHLEYDDFYFHFGHVF